MKYLVRCIAASALLSSLMASNAVPAIAAPSFDCKAGKEDVEKEICRSKKLSALDQQIADAYKAALGRLAGDPAAVSELRDNQRAFVDGRHIPKYGDHEEQMKTHRDFLRSVVPRAGKEFLGVWERVRGAVIIKKGARGKFTVSAETLGVPFQGDCEGGGEDFKMDGAALVSSNGPNEWNQKLTRRGHLLVLEEIEPETRESLIEGQPNYCGANGSLAGKFLPVRGPKPSYGDSILVDP